MPFQVLAVIAAVGGTLAVLVMGGALLFYVKLLNGGEHNTPTLVTALLTPTPTDTAPPPTTPDSEPGDDAPLAITYDITGQYAFPVAADPAQFVWTHFHWDGGNAADIEARFGLSRAEFDQVTQSRLVAVTNGTATNYSGSVGGQGYLLHGDDGVDYYYAHMSEQWVADGSRVTVGQPLGVMGNTGGTAQFIEPHLHLAIGPRDSLWTQQPAVNSAEWLRERFGFDWIERPDVTVAPDLPQDAPVRHPRLVIVTPFDQAGAHGLPQSAVELGFDGLPPGAPQSIVATLGGTINVIRWTKQYGTRIQINNDPAHYTVVISGVDEWLVQDGDVVTRGQTIGRWNPARRPNLHYMIYRDSVIIDPTSSLGLPVAQPGE